MTLSVFYSVFAIAALWLLGCVGAAAPPALVLQVQQITRARVSERGHERRRELAFGAALSVALDAEPRGLPAFVEPAALDPPQLVPEAARCEPEESAICVWAQAAEERSWLAALERLELEP